MSNSKKLAWNDINWTSVQQRTSRIQRRIYKAKQKEKMGLVHHLQNRLINSLDAKLLSVRQVTTLNKGKNTPGHDNKTYTTPKQKLNLAFSLTIGGKSEKVLRVYIPKPNKDERRPLVQH